MKKRWLWAAGALVLCAALLSGWRFYASQLDYRQTQAEERLLAIARLKVAQITAWRQERLGDAEVVRNNRPLIRGLLRWLEGAPEPALLADWQAYFDTMQRQFSYQDYQLVDAAGRFRLGASDPLDPAGQAALAEAWQTHQIVLTDVHWGLGTHDPQLALIIPLFRGAVPAGAIILVIDARRSLYPLIQAWPIPSTTAEALLVRRDGNDALFLNDLRYRPDSALNLRLPLAGQAVPAVQAIQGQTGLVPGPDYRGVPVVAAAYPIPQSPWWLIVKQDRQEVYANVQREALSLAGLLLALLALAGAVFALAWQRRQLAHRRAVADLDDLRLRYAAIVESAEDAIISTDLGGVVNGWNSGAEQLFGYTALEALGQSITFLIPAERREEETRILAQIARGERVSHFETQRRHQDGHLIGVSVSAAPIRDAQGAIVGAAKIARDITERKRIEAELARANQAKGEFLANMSHEIRTPLNAILGLTQILERDTLAPDQQDLLHKISEAGSSLLHIINDILDFSKIEAGQFQIDPAPFGLDALLTRLENLLMATAQQKGLTLTIRSPDGFTDQLVGDSLRIEQVLTNLIGNAIKFTAQGRVEVSVTPLAVTEQTVRLRFAVTDTGVGITPEQREKLFQPFSQADASTTRRFGGTGLGLSISKRLVELMGGTIGVTSTPGQGSTFWFELPLCPAAVATACQQPTPPIAVQGPRLTGLRVLAVDDNRINLFVLQRALQLEGATVTLAADGQQALNTLSASPAAFDVVLMDIQMPVMDGLTATRTIRQDPMLAYLPVIALTAGVMAEERAAAQTAGMSDFLAKPLDLKQMVAVLAPYVPAAIPGKGEFASLPSQQS